MSFNNENTSSLANLPVEFQLKATPSKVADSGGHVGSYVSVHVQHEPASYEKPGRKEILFRMVAEVDPSLLLHNFTFKDVSEENLSTKEVKIYKPIMRKRYSQPRPKSEKIKELNLKKMLLDVEKNESFQSQSTKKAILKLPKITHAKSSPVKIKSNILSPKKLVKIKSTTKKVAPKKIIATKKLNNFKTKPSPKKVMPVQKATANKKEIKTKPIIPSVLSINNKNVKHVKKVAKQDTTLKKPSKSASKTITQPINKSEKITVNSSKNQSLLPIQPKSKPITSKVMDSAVSKAIKPFTPKISKIESSPKILKPVITSNIKKPEVSNRVKIHATKNESLETSNVNKNTSRKQKPEAKVDNVNNELVNLSTDCKEISENILIKENINTPKSNVSGNLVVKEKKTQKKDLSPVVIKNRKLPKESPKMENIPKPEINPELEPTVTLQPEQLPKQPDAPISRICEICAYRITDYVESEAIPKEEQKKNNKKKIRKKKNENCKQCGLRVIKEKPHPKDCLNCRGNLGSKTKFVIVFDQRTKSLLTYCLICGNILQISQRKNRVQRRCRLKCSACYAEVAHRWEEQDAQRGQAGDGRDIDWDNHNVTTYNHDYKYLGSSPTFSSQPLVSVLPTRPLFKHTTTTYTRDYTEPRGVLSFKEFHGRRKILGLGYLK